MKAEEYTEIGVPVVMPRDISGGIIVQDKIARVPEAVANRLGKHRIFKGDILFPRRGDLGRIGVAKEENNGWLCGTGCLRARLKEDVDASYVHQYVQLPSVRKWLEENALGQTMLNLSTGIVARLPVFICPLPEQRAIADLLSTWDSAIEKTERLIAAIKRRFDWLLSCLTSRVEYLCGHIHDFASEVSERNGVNGDGLVLSVTNLKGFVLPEEQFERRVSSSDLSNYKIIKRGQFAYNPSRINVGSVARLDGWDKGILSPMYVVFKLDENKVVSDYFLHWLSSHKARERIRNSAQGSVRESVSFADLGAIDIPLPPLEEQRNIADTLNDVQREIDILKRLAEALRNQKCGLIQQLVTGRWRVKLKGEGVA